ncbi:hypothetical protein EVAR_61875_1 [Eumeta japonica]|uniref:Uncharacterized protein n=1 Tax=Eumeta variegata TaxID=151549 RepID=A0A4C1ZJK6_EUMVA|nr:hypothetical protein EVAR_61875_1 [Eumeta japonica]
MENQKDSYLEELITEYDDVSESSAMDKLFAYMELINEEDNEFMEERIIIFYSDRLNLVGKLHLMVIVWGQPWYQMTNCLTRCLKTEANEEESYRVDQITYDESNLIYKNWLSFVQEYDCPNKPECFARWRNRENTKKKSSPLEQVRRFVTAYLAQGLKRTLPQVYKHFVSKYGYTERGPLSPTEEKVVNICLTHNPKNAVMILSTILRRESRMIYNKQKMLYESKPEKMKRLRWTLERASKFIHSLMHHNDCSLKALRNKEFSREIWLKVEKDMDHPIKSLTHFWYKRLHIQLFVKEDVKLRSLGNKIFETLRYSSYKVWTDIRWKEVVKFFPKGYTPGFLNYIALRAFKLNGLTLKMPLQELIPIALKALREHKNLRLKRLKLNKSGQLVFVDVTVGNEESAENEIVEEIKMEQ